MLRYSVAKVAAPMLRATCSRRGISDDLHLLRRDDFKKELARIDHAVPDPRIKSLDEMVDPLSASRDRQAPIAVTAHDESKELAGAPDEHVVMRRARIFKPAREATQTAWNNTKLWKIELDARDRWENPLMGWCSSSDPLSNVSMNLDFACKDDAVRFCQKRHWQYEVIEPAERRQRPKSYSDAFSWNKKTRVATK